MNYFQVFLEKHPIYNKITYSGSAFPVETHLHPLLSASQAVIDSLLESGNNRIAIVLPDDNINILPLVISKYLSNIQERPEYAHSIFDDIKPGQHLRLGKAVIEFKSFDKENKTIEYLVGKPTKLYSSTKYTTPFQGYHLYFERCSGALSKEATFLKERKKIKQKLETDGIADIDLLALKRTVINKTIALLSPKNDFRSYLDDFFIMGKRFQDVVAYGEFDDSCEDGAALYNLGRLDCLPGLIVSPKISELARGISTESMKERVDTIIITQEKFNETINNIGDFRKCLLKGIPFIMFVPETEFESFPVLSEMGFVFWNWDPNLLKIGGLSSENCISPEDSLFCSLSKKVYNATKSTTELKTIKYQDLQKTNSLIRQAIKQTFESGSSLNQVSRQINKLVKYFIDLVSPISNHIESSIMIQFDEIINTQNTLKAQYEGTDIWSKIETALNSLLYIYESGETPKSKALSEIIKSSEFNRTVILVPDRYLFADDLQEYLNRINTRGGIIVYKAGDFCRDQTIHQIETDHLIVTFFDQAEYIKIKKTYCYKKLTYLLYSFENAWRRGFVNKYESCIQREAVKSHARSIISQPVDEFSWEILDLPEADKNDELDELTEFNFERDLITNIIRRSNTSSDSSDSAECIPVVFNQDTIGYFSPNHNLIDITPLCHGDLDRPVKKDASKLSKGDIVLIRQSDKDIIYDKANELMNRKGEPELRSIAELWVRALQQYAEGKSLPKIRGAMNKHGADCETNQIRYWLLGETICPENRSVVEALSILCPDILPRDKVQIVLSAGSRVQEYHRKAGRWLTSELKNKAGDILNIYQSGKTKGSIDEIGNVHVYVVETVFNKEYVDRNKINRLEVIS